MIEILKYIVFGIVQGLGEVLPISSSAHLIIVQDIFGISDNTLTFEVFLHLASLIAIIVFLRKRLWNLIKGFCLFVFKKNKEYRLEFRYCLMIVISTIPTVIFALILKDYIEEISSILWVIGICLMINGIILWILSRVNGSRKEEDLNYKDAIVIGLFQCLGVLPGISRSGSCLSGAFFRKIDKKTAADYAFTMFIPAVLGATVLELFKFNEISIDKTLILPYVVSFIVCAFTTYFAFKILLSVIKKGKLQWFSYYCLIIGLATYIYGIVR